MPNSDRLPILPRQAQIDHIKEHHEKFVEHQMGLRTSVEDYFEEYYQDYRYEGSDFYLCLCSDLQIQPRGRDAGLGNDRD